MPFRAGACRGTPSEWHFSFLKKFFMVNFNGFYMKHLFIGFLGLTLAMPLAAQSFTDKLERVEAGKGRVVIHQDPAIERLVNGSPEKKKVVEEKQAERTVRNTERTVQSPVSKKEDPDSSENIVRADTTTPKIYRSRYTTVGYRIQVYAGGNSRAAREQAMRKGNQVKQYFADLPVYTHFYSPRWTCRIGDFRSYAEASRVLSELKATGAFSEAVIVKCKIQVAY